MPAKPTTKPKTAAKKKPVRKASAKPRARKSAKEAPTPEWAKTTRYPAKFLR